MYSTLQSLSVTRLYHMLEVGLGLRACSSYFPLFEYAKFIDPVQFIKKNGLSLVLLTGAGRSYYLHAIRRVVECK